MIEINTALALLIAQAAWEPTATCEKQILRSCTILKGPGVAPTTIHQPREDLIILRSKAPLIRR